MLEMRCIRISNAPIAQRSGRKWPTQKDKDEHGPLSTGDVSGGGGGAELFTGGRASAPDAAGGEPGDRQAGGRVGRDAAGAQLARRNADGRRRSAQGVCAEDAESAGRCELRAGGPAVDAYGEADAGGQ